MRLGTVIAMLLSVSPCRAQPPAAGQQVTQKLDLGERGSIEYLIYLPKMFNTARKWPLLLFLHGRGERGGPIGLVKKWGPPRLINQGRDFPYIVVSPQCARDATWEQAGEQAKLHTLLDHLESNWPVDQGRIYVTGLSMGGTGTWVLSATFPERFAAIAPICGRGHAADAAKLKDLPIWAWHGLADTVVDPQQTNEIVEAIRKVGGKQVIYTALEGVGHNAWSAAYATPELYSWLNRHRLEVVEVAR